MASDWPELLEIARQLVKPERDGQPRDAVREKWWQFEEKRPSLYAALREKEIALVAPQTSPHLTIAVVPAQMIFDQTLTVFVPASMCKWAVLQSRVHEIWVREFAATLEDRLRYTPSDCFETFPLPAGYDGAPDLEDKGTKCHDHRAAIMSATNKGMTKTYNRFHDPHDMAADIVELRRLHAMIDDAVLRDYGWDDLADRAHPGDPANCIAPGEDAARFLTEDDEDDHKYQNRLFWPAPFRDELLARLLKLNEERAAAEKKGN